MWVNGQRQVIGAGNDFTITSTTVNWLATADFDIDASDEVIMVYQA